MCGWQLAAAGYVSKSSKADHWSGKRTKRVALFPKWIIRAALCGMQSMCLALPMLKAKHKYSPPPSPCMQHPSTKATHLVLSFSCPLKCQQCKPLPKLFVPRTNISTKTKFRQALPCKTWPSINSWAFMSCYWNSLIQKLTI